MGEEQLDPRGAFSARRGAARRRDLLQRHRKEADKLKRSDEERATVEQVRAGEAVEHKEEGDLTEVID